jgi:protocatechuate 3,4-dioxygenase, alpha subunit
MHKQTPSQTLGPFFAYALSPAAYGRVGIASEVLIDVQTRGQRITVHGVVRDGAGAPVSDALVEIWQANAAGRYAHPEDMRESEPLDVHFQGFGRAETMPDGSYSFSSIKPGAVTADQAPHINVVVTARGMLSHVFTRVYFADEANANAQDRVLASVPESRRHTLIATRTDAQAIPEYQFDICLQGPNETVFFDA